MFTEMKLSELWKMCPGVSIRIKDEWYYYLGKDEVIGHSLYDTKKKQIICLDELYDEDEIDNEDELTFLLLNGEGPDVKVLVQAQLVKVLEMIADGWHKTDVRNGLDITPHMRELELYREVEKIMSDDKVESK